MNTAASSDACAPGSGPDRAGTHPVDLETMRQSVDRLLDPDAVPEALPPADDELATLTAMLRGYLGLLIPEVEQQLEKLPDKESASRYCALACLGDARYRLRGEPHHRCDSPLAHARCLARAVNALCNHYESLHDALSKTPA